MVMKGWGHQGLSIIIQILGYLLRESIMTPRLGSGIRLPAFQSSVEPFGRGGHCSISESKSWIYCCWTVETCT